MTLEEIIEEYAIDCGHNTPEDMEFKDLQICDLINVAHRYAQSQTQELIEWKESMMKVHIELDLQGIGKALGLPLGSSIAPQVLPEIIGLIERNNELIEALHNVANLLESDSQISVESIKRVLTKYNHLKSKTNESNNKI